MAVLNDGKLIMTENWTHWKPAQNLAAKYYIDAVMSNIDGFKIELTEYHNENKQCKQ
jgi:hypothetical protein